VKEGGEGDPMRADRWTEALTWRETLQEAGARDVTNPPAREWQRWYADAENQRIFDAVSRLLGDRILYCRRRRPSREKLEADEYDPSIPIAEWRKRHSSRLMRNEHAPAANWARWLSGGFAAATVALIAVLVIVWPPRFRSVGYQTSIGELRTVHLRDGSTIILGGRTELSVAFSGQRRSVKLIEGQAWFKVAHDPNWPFVVAAGGGTITDVGTAFVVTRENDRVVVTVTYGTVEVTTQKPQRTPHTIAQGVAPTRVLTPIRVTEGEELAYSDKGTLSPIVYTDLHAATAWTHGRLTFDDKPLRDVVTAVDRYSSRKIAVTQRAGALRLSGIVHTNEIDDWLHGLEKIFPVRVEQRGATVCIDVRDLTPAPRQADTPCSTQQ
jgi:transmembrane sensor